MYKSRSKVNLLKNCYRNMLWTYLNFFGLDYRVDSLITLYFVVPGIKIPKIRSIGWLDHIKICCSKSKKSTCLKWTYGHSGNYYRVATIMSFVTWQTVVCWVIFGKEHLNPKNRQSILNTSRENHISTDVHRDKVNYRAASHQKVEDRNTYQINGHV